MLAAYTRATVGDFIMSNWTDIHVVDPDIRSTGNATHTHHVALIVVSHS